MSELREAAHAKVNLVLQVGAPRPDGLHPLCSLFARLDLADALTVRPAERDQVRCPGVRGRNLASRALAAYRRRVTDGLPPLRIEIEKRIPVAAGLGGGSADAAAVLRAANELAGRPLAADELRALAAELGSDVPSQVEPGHALVTGTGDRVERLALPEMWLVLLPSGEGLKTADVYAELDRTGGWRDRLDPDRLRGLSGQALPRLAAAVENDLEAPALALRPGLRESLSSLERAGALGAAVSGSGPTTFGVFPGKAAAREAAARTGGLVAHVEGGG